jgi:hypothetical protein
MALKMKIGNEGAGSGASWLKEPGKYHAMILHADENPVDKDKNPIDGFKIQFLVIAGDQKGKQLDLTFYNPDMSKSEKAIAFAERKQAACLVALGLITEQQFGTEAIIDLNAATNPPRQFFIELEKQEGKEFLSLCYANIYHIDDPACADPVIWQRDAGQIAKLPPACRRDPASFPKHERGSKAGTASGATGGAGGPGTGQQQPAKNVSFEGF